jgi:hypothetical protein
MLRQYPAERFEMDEELKKLREAAEGAMDMFERNGNPGIASARLAYVIAVALVDIAASLRRAAPMETATDMREVTP